jgi:large subunit ribosomal protein L4
MARSAPYIGTGGSVDLDPNVFEEPFHPSLVHEAVRAERNARRRGTASTKTRAEVAMSGGKAWRQKGTGRARAGPLSAPQRTGGGVAFGPRPRSYTVKVNRKARRRALRAVLSAHAERGSLAVVDADSFDTPSTRRAAEALEGLGGSRALLVLALGGGEASRGTALSAEQACARSFRNLAEVSVTSVDRVGVADLVGARRLVLSPAALERLQALARPPVEASERRRVGNAAQTPLAGDAAASASPGGRKEAP